MSERIEQIMWLPDRGLTVTLPPDSVRHFSPDKTRTSVLETTRYKLISHDHILKTRHPTPDAGEQYMASTDLSWRETLYFLATDVANFIVAQAREMGLIKNLRDAQTRNEDNDIAVLMFGSVAKRLSRTQEHQDPSNIDLAIIMPTSEGQKEEMFDRIRAKRAEVTAEIGNNVGVHIQSANTIRQEDYSPATEYIKSSTRALYDQSRIWQTIEAEALLNAYLKQSYKESRDKLRIIRTTYTKDPNILQNIIDEHWLKISQYLQEELKNPLVDQAFRELAGRRLGYQVSLYDTLKHPELLVVKPTKCVVRNEATMEETSQLKLMTSR